MSLKLVESKSDISKLIMAALDKDITTYFNLLDKKLRSELGPIIKYYIEASSVYDALAHDLMPELGMEEYDSRTRMEEIIDHWIRNIEVNITQRSIEVNYIKDDYSDVINLSAAIFNTENHYDLPWLKWLLFFGTRNAVTGHSILYTHGGRLKAKLAVMVEHDNWRVPSEYSGTQKDNFVTNAIEDAAHDIEQMILKLAQETEVP